MKDGNGSSKKHYREHDMTLDYPLVSVIVLNFNGRRFLEECFSSLERVDYPNFEVVMVDNKSSDHSVEYVREHFSSVRVIEAPENNGFSAGNNIGIKETYGKYVFLLNNDTICTPDFLTNLVKVAESDQTIGIVGSWPLDHRYRMYKDLVLRHQAVQVAAVGGAAMLIRRDVIDQIGLLDEKYFFYWEDTEFCWRANLRGYKVMTVYDSFVYHMVNGTGLPTKKKWMYEFVKNKIYTHIKLMNCGYLGFFLLYEMLRSFGRMILHPILAPSVLKGWWWNINHLEINLKERKRIRSDKKISDWELIKLMFRDEVLMRRDWKRLHELSEQDRKIISTTRTQKEAT